MNQGIEIDEKRLLNAAWENAIKHFTNKFSDLPNNVQKIHTPFDLCHQMITRLETFTPLRDKKFLTLNLEFVEILIKDFGVNKENIWFATDCIQKAQILKHPRYSGVNVIGDFLKEKINMKFDCVIMNPPYQTKSDTNDTKNTQPLWHFFVKRALDVCKTDGFLVTIHPAGWRNVAGKFKETQNLLKSKSIKYLKLNSFRDGQLMFNVAINFDYYVLQNKNNDGSTNIIFENGETNNIDLSKLEFIPSENFHEIMSLVAKDGEEKCEVLYSRSAYGSDKPHMSKIQTEEFKYPCVYTVKSPNNGNIPTFRYSNINTNGHFGISKVIFARGASGVCADNNGQYGLTEFASAIVDNPTNLDNIKKALQTEKFIRNIMGFKASLGDKYNRKIIALFKKDFWKHFVDENGNEI